MTSYETVAIAYFILVALIGSQSSYRRRGWLYSAGALILVIVARFLPGPLRVWMPHAYLVLGYWIPAAFSPEPRDDRFERWLLRADARLAFLGSWDLGFGILELAYLLCYPLVPAAFLVVWMMGQSEEVGRFWMAVLLAGYACYVTLPWTAAPPPRRTGGTGATGATGAAGAAGAGTAALNAFVLRRFSHGHITFPSGHVAVSIAAALVVADVSRSAGALFGVMAVAIAIAAVAGRYHYRVDVVVGALVGVLARLAAG
jgi:hypothetical protein